MMTEEELIKKLKKTARFEHTGIQKEYLWTRLSAYIGTKEVTTTFWHFGFRATYLAVVALVILLGSAGVTFAAQNSLPGQPLYPVKRFSEEANISLKFNEKDKRKARIQLTTKRVDEISKLISNDPERAEEALTEYENQMNEYEEAFSEDPELSKAFRITIEVNGEVLMNIVEQAPDELKEKVKSLLPEEEPSDTKTDDGTVEGEKDSGGSSGTNDSEINNTFSPQP